MQTLLSRASYNQFSLEHFKGRNVIDPFYPPSIVSAHFDGLRVNGGRTGTLLLSFICQEEIGQWFLIIAICHRNWREVKLCTKKIDGQITKLFFYLSQVHRHMSKTSGKYIQWNIWIIPLSLHTNIACCLYSMEHVITAVASWTVFRILLF